MHRSGLSLVYAKLCQAMSTHITACMDPAGDNHADPVHHDPTWWPDHTGMNVCVVGLVINSTTSP